MLIERIGRRSFALGLTWRELHEAPADELESAYPDGTEGVLHVVLRSGKGAEAPAVIGYAKPGAKVGKVYSLAAAVASSGVAGIFVAPISEGRWWMAVVEGGRVLPETDRVDDRAHIEDSVANILAARDGELLLFAPAGTRFPGSQSWDLEKLAATTKTPALKAVEAGLSPVAIVLVLGVCVGLAYGGWAVLGGGGVTPEQRAADEAEAARQMYVSNVTTALQGLPVDHAWINLAMAKVVESAPPYVAGWEQDSVTCLPSACTVRYVADDKAPRSPTLLREALGPSISVGPDNLSATLTVAINAPTVAIDDALIRRWPAAPDETADRVSMAPLYLAGTVFESDPAPEDLSANSGGLPPGYEPIVRTTVVIKPNVERHLLDADVASLADYWANGGFKPVQWTWSRGYGPTPATWRAEFVRVSGRG